MKVLLTVLEVAGYLTLFTLWLCGGAIVAAWQDAREERGR
jgi:hypothetical protein